MLRPILGWANLQGQPGFLQHLRPPSGDHLRPLEFPVALAVSSVPPAGTLCGLRVLSAGPRPAPGAVAWADRDARDGRCGWAEAAICVQPGRVWTQVALPLPLPPGPEPGWGQVGLHRDSFCSWLLVPTPLGRKGGVSARRTRACVRPAAPACPRAHGGEGLSAAVPSGQPRGAPRKTCGRRTRRTF